MTDDDDTRTVPWHADELLLVDGQRCVYTMRRCDVQPLVRLPGGDFASPAQLRARGHVVVLPRRWRFDASDAPKLTVHELRAGSDSEYPIV